MIKYNPRNWKLLFSYKGSLLRKLAPSSFLLALLTTCLCILHIKYKVINIQVSTAIPGYLGAALGLLLVFRNNTAYDKWWEARKELGGLVNTCRNMALVIKNIVPDSNPLQTSLSNAVLAFACSMKSHLRDESDVSDLKGLLTDLQINHLKLSHHKAVAVAGIMQEQIQQLGEEKIITQLQVYQLTRLANNLVDILGKCERIKNTPIPIAYAFLLKFFIIIYAILLPFGLLDEVGWGSIPMVLALYYIMMSIVLTAEEIEEPFGHDINDLSFGEIVTNIKKNITEIMRTKA